MLDALEQAIHQSRPAQDQLVHHSDRGSQYLSIKYNERLAEAKIAPSVGSVGDMYGDAQAETIKGLFTAAARGAALKRSNIPPFNWSINLTTAACWSLSAISHQPKQRQTSTRHWEDQT